MGGVSVDKQEGSKNDKHERCGYDQQAYPRALSVARLSEALRAHVAPSRLQTAEMTEP